MEFEGTRWFKCDLHLHTTASKCFQDQSVTPKQWVDRAIAQGLDCVAVTDHNTGILIDAIKSEAEIQGLTVFPGVEITCDSSKVHLLILFDTDKSSDHIRDFLVRADIKREQFGEQTAFTSKSIFDIAYLANQDGGLIIPAHIDEYNGLGKISVSNLEKFFDLEFINAVQVVHRPFLDPDLTRTTYDELVNPLNQYYGNPSLAIDESTIKEWHNSVKLALQYDLSITTFSDNPHKLQSPKHGLYGIGRRFTWIKMDKSPSLEGLRQAFLLPEFRVKNDFESSHNPYRFPNLWIKSIEVSNTSITDENTSLKIDFNPQLNTIIGGRGSGKSSILRFIRGAFNRTIDLYSLDEILRDHSEFYRRTDSRTKKGIFTANSKIKVEFVRDGVVHLIVVFDIEDSQNQTTKIFRIKDNDTQEEVTSEGYLDFFEFEHYSQKQIYEIAQEPNALRERIDNAIIGLDPLISERQNIKTSFLAKSSSIRDINQRISGKGILQTEMQDLQEKINLLQESGIADLITAKEKFLGEKSALDSFIGQVKERENTLSEVMENFDLNEIDISLFDQSHSGEILPLTNAASSGIQNIKSNLQKLKQKLREIKSTFDHGVSNSKWKITSITNITNYEEKKLELESQGVDAISNFEQLLEQKSRKGQELEKISELEVQLMTQIQERINLQNDYLTKTKEITTKRRHFILNILNDDKVRIKVKPLRNQNDFEQKLRGIIQREGGFQDDVEKLRNHCFQGNVEQRISEFRKLFLDIRANKTPEIEVSGWLINVIKQLNPAQVDEIEILLPEDEIEVEYRITSDSPFKTLSVASAGQKTTAILTFILSFGQTPLILDQPEDDLDNRLVYDLIVDRLKKAKEQRQIIVVTHNANIPVNGDAEYIISMDSESRTLNVIQTGTVEQPTIKKEICDVMEGSEQAFKMRSKRYEVIN